MHREGDKLIIEPVRKRGLLALVATWKPAGRGFFLRSMTNLSSRRKSFDRQALSARYEYPIRSH